MTHRWTASFAANLVASIDWGYVFSVEQSTPRQVRSGCPHDMQLVGDMLNGETVTLCNACGERLA